MLKEKIKSDLESAVKEKKTVDVSVLRMLLASILNKEKEKRFKLSQKPGLNEKKLEEESQLNQEETLSVVFSETKKRKESIESFEKGARADLVEKEKQELEVLKKYLPEQISDEEISKMAKEAIGKLGAKEMKDMGGVIKEIMSQVKGRADGSRVSQIVKELLGND